jgi:hypothetical protein
MAPFVGRKLRRRVTSFSIAYNSVLFTFFARHMNFGNTKM